MSKSSITLLVLLFLVCGGGCGPRDVSVSETPIEIVKEHVGSGTKVRAGDLVTINYRASLPDGTIVLNEKNFRFILGTGAVIEGVDETVLGMRVHGRRIVNCPPHKHWGRCGTRDGAVPENTFLTLEVTLTEVD